MSSHHFVKEGQEPAIYLRQSLDQDTLFQLLEWSPIVIVHEDLIDEIIVYGVNIDAVILDTLLHECREKLSYQLPIDFLHIDKNMDMQVVGDYLQSKECKSLHYSGKFDESKFSTALLDNIHTVTVWDGEIKWILIKGGDFKKWSIAGRQFFTRTTDGVSSHGDIFVVEDDQDFKKVILKSDGFISFKSDKPGFWLGEHIY